MAEWTLGGLVASEIALSPADQATHLIVPRGGDRYLLGTEDGKLSWIDRSGKTLATRQLGGELIDLVRSPDGHTVMAWAGDRLHFLSDALEPRGEIFLHLDGWVAVTPEGVYSPTDTLQAQVAAIDDSGDALLRKGAVPAIDRARALRILLDNFSLWERLGEMLVRAARRTREVYQGLGWLKVPFWPALGWTLLALSMLAVWLVAPRKLAHWSMPVADAPELPAWRWIVNVYSFVGLLGTTQRALRAWVKDHHSGLRTQTFTDRRPVRERDRFCPLGWTDLLKDVERQLANREPVRLWIVGAGGSGKSALAYAILRRSTGDSSRPLPVLVDEDWTGDLFRHLSRLWRLDGEDRGPTPAMMRALGANGHFCLLMDSLSERGVEDADEQISKALTEDKLRAVIITSREPPPPGRIWETFRHVEARPVSRLQVPAFATTYVQDEACRDRVLKRLAPLLEGDESFNPLYLRFAIERATVGELEEVSWSQLVLDYLEGLRADRIDLWPDDMVRACRLAAVESLRGADTPREIESQYLRGVFARESDGLRFADASGEGSVAPAAVVEMLVTSGVLLRNQENRRWLQFTYDPVAEQLAALDPGRPTGTSSLPLESNQQESAPS